MTAPPESLATVVTAQPTGSPRIRRLVLEVAEPARLTVPDVPDAAVGVYLPAPDGGAPTARNYSVRTQDGDRVTLDVVLHGHGHAAAWAAAAAPGAQVTLAYGHSWYAPQPETDWQLLVADLAGLPALARIVEELPQQVPVVAVVEVADESDLGYLPPLPTAVRLVPVVGSGNGLAPSRLGRTVTDLELPAGRGYCWLGAEAAQARAVRKLLRRENRWETRQLDVLGYWREKQERWAERFAPVQEQLLAVYDRAVAEGCSDAEATERYDEALERAGL